MTEAIKDFKINFDSLLKLGYGVIDVRFKEYDVTNSEFKYVIVLVEKDRDTFYVDMLKDYTGQEFKQNEVLDIWKNILDHKVKMSEILKRDVSIKVATMDFLES
jgi:hypothetical protein